MIKKVVLTEDEQIAGLFEYIRLNKPIPDFFADIKLHPTNHADKLTELKKAVDKGDFDASIFQDEHATLYLLYLIKEKTIPYLQGMTVYSYLIGLAQFTPLQALRPEDDDVKSLRSFRATPIIFGDKLTPLGEQYIKHVCDSFEKFAGIHLDYDSFVDLVTHLTTSEQSLFEVQGYKAESNTAINTILMLCEGLPFCMATATEEISLDKNYYIPSTTILDYLTTKLSTNPLQPKYILGSIGDSTLHQLHNMYQHPMALYSRFVKSNLHDVDGGRCGPFAALIHDIAHCYWGNLLSDMDKEKIFHRFLPMLEILKSQAEKMRDDETITLISKVINRVYDFNLVYEYHYAKPENRLRYYLASTLGHRGLAGDFGIYSSNSIMNVRTQKIGGCPEDKFFFLMGKLNEELKNSSPADYELLNIPYTYTRENTGKFTRQDDIVEAIASVSKTVVNGRKPAQSLMFNKVDITLSAQKWQEILAATTDSKQIWDKIMENGLDAELVALICYRELAFFEPYVPLSGLEYNRLKNIVSDMQENIENDKSHLPSRECVI